MCVCCWRNEGGEDETKMSVLCENVYQHIAIK